MESDRDLLERMKSLIHVTKRVHIKDAAAMLDLDRVTFLKKVMEWGKTIPFKIDGDDLVVDDAAAVIESIDRQFAHWESISESVDNKVQSAPAAGSTGDPLGHAGETSGRTLVDRGIDAVNRKDWPTARDLIRKALDLKLDWGDPAILWFYLGNALEETDDLSAAIYAYRKAISLSGTDDRALGMKLRLGWALYAFGDFKGARDVASELHEIKPDLAEAWVLSGSCRVKLDDVFWGIQDCRRAMNLSPNSSLAWYALGNAYTAKGKFRKGSEALQKAKQLELVEKEKEVETREMERRRVACKACGSMNKETVLFCINCGSKIEKI